MSYAYPLLRRWLKAGYAVVRTDYDGLGTPGVHGYLVGATEGAASWTPCAPLARSSRGCRRRFVVAGHSQGGHAALFAASLAPKWVPELRLRGTVAFAPASHLAEQFPLTRQRVLAGRRARRDHRARAAVGRDRRNRRSACRAC